MSSGSDGGGHFEISALLEKRKSSSGLIEYKVNWEGYGNHEDTWELRKSLIEDGHRDLITAFEAALRGEDMLALHWQRTFRCLLSTDSSSFRPCCYF